VTTKATLQRHQPVPAAIAFAGTYKGTLAIVWGDTYLQITSITGKGTGNVLGLTDMSGTASAAPAGLCDTFDGKGRSLVAVETHSTLHLIHLLKVVQKMSLHLQQSKFQVTLKSQAEQESMQEPQEH
jgi:hypothetical protein